MWGSGRSGWRGVEDGGMAGLRVCEVGQAGRGGEVV